MCAHHNLKDKKIHFLLNDYKEMIINGALMLFQWTIASSIFLSMYRKTLTLATNEIMFSERKEIEKFFLNKNSKIKIKFEALNAKKYNANFLVI